MGKKVFLFDGTSLAYKAFYALKGLSTSKGFPTNAIYGFIRMFLKLYKEFKPVYGAVAFDVSKKTFRSKISKTYKANRKPTPDNLKLQLPYIKKFLECFGIPVIEKEGYEADDILGTLANKLSKLSCDVVIVTPDKDMRQLINEKVTVVATSNKKGKEEVFTLSSFKERYGVEPSQLPDVFALSGDSIDNIPGVPGIGEKTALKLISQFGSLENLYENLEKLPPKRKEQLEKFKEQAFTSKELAKIKVDVPIDITLEDLKLKRPNFDCLTKLLSELEMKSVFQELKKLFPDALFSVTNLEKGRELKKEELEKEFSKDLFSHPEFLLLHNSSYTISLKEGYCVLSKEEVKGFLKRANRFFTFDLKSLFHKLKDESIKEKAFDLSVAYYLLDPLLKSYSPKSLLEKHLGIVELKEIQPYSHYLLKFGEETLSALKRENLLSLYEKLEHPLIYVLYRMEEVGVPFNKEYLKSFGKELEEKFKKIEEKIFEISGEKFNLNSPKQLAEVLFEKLKIKPVKKTKTGYSTDVETLTVLSQQGYEIAKLLLEYRKLSKLYSTFVKGILKHVKEDGRVRTTFLQTQTATGRLSSAEPNLQNLPVSDELSKRVRRAVEAPEGKVLVWADYSQIELRVLAHLSGDERLISAYKEGKDIHTETAFYLFGKVDETLRRIAKTVNFGIIYGMSPHGLAERLGIPVDEAAEYINTYFKKFPKVKEYIDSTVEEAYKKGYVKTLFGRKRPLPELRAKSKTLRDFGERAAVNATIQGTAADIMKLAMVELLKPLEEIESFMILQVHDEIVVEAPKGKEEEVKKIVKEVMENVVSLKVPLSVTVESGKYWN